MRKIIISITIILCAIATVNAQDSALVTRKGVHILPKAGDLAIGMDANPFLQYIGNVVKFSGTNNVAPTANFLTANTIYLKYFTSDKTALRFRLQFDNTNVDNKKYVFDDSDPTQLEPTVADVQTHIVNNYTVALGYEWRRGRTRLQGFYGAEVIYGYSNDNYKYSYANPITQANPRPTTDFIDFGNANAGGGQITGYRVLTDNRGGRASTFGLGGFIGVEYFFFPSISLGAELSWNLSFTKISQQKVTSEIWNGKSVETRTDVISPSTTSFSTSTSTSSPSSLNDASGHLYLMFHF